MKLPATVVLLKCTSSTSTTVYHDRIVVHTYSWLRTVALGGRCRSKYYPVHVINS
jgi:hypothetical protein